MKNKGIFILSLAMICNASPVFARTTAKEFSPNMQIVRASFQQDDSVILPTDFHRWVHVGTFVKEGGINIFDNSKIIAPLIGNTYIEPSAYNYFMAHGKWADGSQIVKEFTEALDDKTCDQTSHVCKTAFGAAIYQQRYTGYGYMIKDKQRFPEAAGNWGFFTTGNVNPPYPETTKVESASKCSSCHIAHASDQDFVFAAQKIGLERANPNNR